MQSSRPYLVLFFLLALALLFSVAFGAVVIPLGTVARLLLGGLPARLFCHFLQMRPHRPGLLGGQQGAPPGVPDARRVRRQQRFPERLRVKGAGISRGSHTRRSGAR